MREKALRVEYRFWSTSQRRKPKTTLKLSSLTTCAPRSATKSVSVQSLARSSAPIATTSCLMGSTRFLSGLEHISPSSSTSLCEGCQVRLVWSSLAEHRSRRRF
jgi:hypothetical protein